MEQDKPGNILNYMNSSECSRVLMDYTREYEKIKKNLPSKREKLIAFIFLLFTLIVILTVLVELIYGNTPVPGTLETNVILFASVYFIGVMCFTAYVFTKAVKGKKILYETINKNPGFDKFYYEKAQKNYVSEEIIKNIVEITSNKQDN